MIVIKPKEEGMPTIRVRRKWNEDFSKVFLCFESKDHYMVKRLHYAEMRQYAYAGYIKYELTSWVKEFIEGYKKAKHAA